MWTKVLVAMLCVCSAIATDKQIIRSAHVVQADLSSEGNVKVRKASYIHATRHGKGAGPTVCSATSPTCPENKPSCCQRYKNDAMKGNPRCKKTCDNVLEWKPVGDDVVCPATSDQPVGCSEGFSCCQKWKTDNEGDAGQPKGNPKCRNNCTKEVTWKQVGIADAGEDEDDEGGDEDDDEADANEDDDSD